MLTHTLIITISGWRQALRNEWSIIVIVLNINHIRLVTLAEHTSDHGTQNYLETKE